MKTIEEIIDILVNEHDATITENHAYNPMKYSVIIFDHTLDPPVDQEMDLTEDELIDIYETYFSDEDEDDEEDN